MILSGNLKGIWDVIMYRFQDNVNMCCVVHYDVKKFKNLMCCVLKRVLEQRLFKLKGLGLGFRV